MVNPTPQTLSQRWHVFTQAEPAARRELFAQTIDDGLMTPTMAAQMAARLHQDTAVADDRPAFNQIMARLHAELPAVYEDAGPAVIQWPLLNALLANNEDAIAVHALLLAKTATRHLDAFINALDMLAYHGETAVLRKTLRQAWPALQNVDASKRQLISALAARATDEVIYDWLAQGNDPADPALAEKLAHYFPIDAEGLARYTAVLTGQVRQQWSPTDFIVDRTTEDEPGTNSRQAAANLGALLIEFVSVLHHDHGSSYSRAALIRSLLPTYFSARRTGQLNPREDIASMMQGKRPFPKISRDEPAHPLCPDEHTLERYLAQLLHQAKPRPYRAAVLYESLPAWLDFLMARELITAVDEQRATTALRELRPAMVRYWQAYASDPTLLANLPAI